MPDKVVFITGASSGIGLACARRYIKAGFKVAAMARSIEKLKEQFESDSNILCLQGDVSIATDCAQGIEACVQQYGRLDVLICNAGISMRALVIDCKLEVIEQVMATNFWGAVYCTKYALPYLLQVGGSVVAVSSIAGKKGLPARSGYSASKFALEGFMESLRTENIKTGLHVLVTCPGYTASDIRNRALSKDGIAQGDTPLDEQKLMSAEQVADEIFVAVQKRKRDLILTAQGKLTVLLNKFFPAWLDKKVFNLISKEKDSPFR